MILFYFGITVTVPIHDLVSSSNLHPEDMEESITEKEHQICIKDHGSYRGRIVASWHYLCGRHWPELFHYYFVHLDQKYVSLMKHPMKNCLSTCSFSQKCLAFAVLNILVIFSLESFKLKYLVISINTKHIIFKVHHDIFCSLYKIYADDEGCFD